MRLVTRRMLPLETSFAFVGGAVVPLLVDHPDLTEFRPTKDVDLVTQDIKHRGLRPPPPPLRSAPTFPLSHFQTFLPRPPAALLRSNIQNSTLNIKHRGLQPPPFVTLTRSLLLVPPAVACGHLPRAPTRSGARYLLLKISP